MAAHTVILTQILFAAFFRFQNLSHVCPFESAAMMWVLKQRRAEKHRLVHSKADRDGCSSTDPELKCCFILIKHAYCTLLFSLW